MPDPVAVFYPNKPLIVVLSALIGGFAILAALMAADVVFATHGTRNWFAKAILWAGASYFLLAISTWLDQLFFRGPTVEISHAGIRDRRFSREEIEWDEIESISTWGHRWIGATFVVVQLQPGVLRRFPRTWRRKIIDAGNALFGGGIYMSTVELDCTVNDLLQAIDRFAPQRLVRPPHQRPAATPASSTSPDLDDPSYWLHNPPADAEIMDVKGRRVVRLTDGRVTAELLSGRARWFASVEEFRDFIGD